MDGVRRNASPFEIRMEYFHWLCSIVEADDPDHPYMKLAEVLFETDFYYTVNNDCNRATDGEHLRESYISQSSYSDYSSILRRPCSVLEMMIALAIRIEEEIVWDPDKGNRTVVWFWEMVQNLGLDDLDDRVFEKNNGYDECDFALGVMLGRTYTRDGRGSLFPMPGFDGNMRQMELWYQMNQYFWKYHQREFTDE